MSATYLGLQTHSRCRPTDHIQAAALAFAVASKIDEEAYGVVRQVLGRNWNSPDAPDDRLTARGLSPDSQRATLIIAVGDWPYRCAAAVMMAIMLLPAGAGTGAGAGAGRCKATGCTVGAGLTCLTRRKPWGNRSTCPTR